MQRGLWSALAMLAVAVLIAVSLCLAYRLRVIRAWGISIYFGNQDPQLKGGKPKDAPDDDLAT